MKPPPSASSLKQESGKPPTSASSSKQINVPSLSTSSYNLVSMGASPGTTGTLKADDGEQQLADRKVRAGEPGTITT